MHTKQIIFHNVTGDDFEITGEKERFLVTSDEKYTFKFNANEAQYYIYTASESDSFFAFMILMVMTSFGMMSLYPTRSISSKMNSMNKKINTDRYAEILEVLRMFVGFTIDKDSEFNIVSDENDSFLCFRLLEENEKVPLYLYCNEERCKEIKDNESSKIKIFMIIIISMMLLLLALLINEFNVAVLVVVFLFDLLSMRILFSLVERKKTNDKIYDLFKNSKVIEITDENIYGIIKEIERN